MSKPAAFSLICAIVLAGGSGCHYLAVDADAPVPHAADRPAAAAKAEVGAGLSRVIILAAESPDASTRTPPRLTVERQGGVRLATGALEAYATLRNHTVAPRQLEVRTEFFGAQGESVEGPSAWRSLLLAPEGLVTFKDRSLALDHVESFRMEVREVR